MNKRIFFFIFLFSALFTSWVYAWQIENFKVDIDINQDSSILVSETILADFSDQPKHGIFRKIPVVYRDEKGNSLNVALRVLDVHNAEGKPWQYEESRVGAYKVIKIGSPHVTYNGQQTYVIRYKVTGALLFLNDHDELYWNATGTEWDVPIIHAIVNVNLPAKIAEESLKTKSYIGRQGSKQDGSPATVLSQETLVFSEDNFQSGDGLTIVVGWPKGIVNPHPLATTYEEFDYHAPSDHRKPLYNSGFNFIKITLLVLILPALTFLTLFGIWNKYGKDPQLLKSVVVEYKVPEDLAPAEMGMLIDDRIDMRDISATIIDLAVRGYLKIIEADVWLFPKKYSFQKLKDFHNDATLKPFEKTILNGIFEYEKVGELVDLSSLENEFYKKLPIIKEEIFDNLKDRKYYKTNPQTTTRDYRILSAVIFGIASFSFTIFPPLGISLGLSAVIVFIYAKYMPAKTRMGMDAYGKILGFEEFLTRTDKDKIQREEQQNIFEKILPYAICLGIATQWARFFADIYKQAPVWYVGTYGRDRPFSLDNFTRDLNRSVSYMGYSFSTAPRTVSSGGGFGGGGGSGGGFGGGGGGSW